MIKKIKFVVLTAAVATLISCSKSDTTTPTATATAPTVVADNVVGTAGTFSKNVLIEDYTGTWCGWCPRISYGISQVELKTTKSVTVAIHNADSMTPAEEPSLRANAGVTGFPTGKLNRITNWNYPEDSNINQVLLQKGSDAKLGLAMTSSVAAGTLNLTVDTKFAQAFTGLKLVVYVLEDGIIANQTNYTTRYGGTATIVGFRHDHVLRKVLTAITGDAIPDASTGVNATYTKTLSVPVPSNVANVANMKLAAFVVDGSGKAINSRASSVGVSQTVEQY